MGKRKLTAAVFALCALSAAAGILLGYFVVGSVGVSAMKASFEEAEELSLGKNIFQEAKIETQKPQLQNQNFIVASKDDFIVVYCADTLEIIETTFTHVTALPHEEQERLANGIYILGEEALMRILEDYGS